MAGHVAVPACPSGRPRRFHLSGGHVGHVVRMYSIAPSPPLGQPVRDTPRAAPEHGIPTSLPPRPPAFLPDPSVALSRPPQPPTLPRPPTEPPKLHRFPHPAASIQLSPRTLPPRTTPLRSPDPAPTRALQRPVDPPPPPPRGGRTHSRSEWEDPPPPCCGWRRGALAYPPQTGEPGQRAPSEDAPGAVAARPEGSPCPPAKRGRRASEPPGAERSVAEGSPCAPRPWWRGSLAPRTPSPPLHPSSGGRGGGGRAERGEAATAAGPGARRAGGRGAQCSRRGVLALRRALQNGPFPLERCVGALQRVHRARKPRADHRVEGREADSLADPAGHRLGGSYGVLDEQQVAAPGGRTAVVGPAVAAPRTGGRCPVRGRTHRRRRVSLSMRPAPRDGAGPKDEGQGTSFGRPRPRLVWPPREFRDEAGAHRAVGKVAAPFARLG